MSYCDTARHVKSCHAKKGHSLQKMIEPIFVKKVIESYFAQIND